MNNFQKILIVNVFLFAALTFFNVGNFIETREKEDEIERSIFKLRGDLYDLAETQGYKMMYTQKSMDYLAPEWVKIDSKTEFKNYQTIKLKYVRE